MDENPLISDSNCNMKIYNPSRNSQGMTNNVGLTFDVGDAILQFTISIEQDNSNLWH